MNIYLDQETVKNKVHFVVWGTSVFCTDIVGNTTECPIFKEKGVLEARYKDHRIFIVNPSDRLKELVD